MQQSMNQNEPVDNPARFKNIFGTEVYS
jgi:hypothetical protein